MCKKSNDSIEDVVTRIQATMNDPPAMLRGSVLGIIYNSNRGNENFAIFNFDDRNAMSDFMSYVESTDYAEIYWSDGALCRVAVKPILEDTTVLKTYTTVTKEVLAREGRIRNLPAIQEAIRRGYDVKITDNVVTIKGDAWLTPLAGIVASLGANKHFSMVNTDITVHVELKDIPQSVGTGVYEQPEDNGNCPSQEAFEKSLTKVAT